MLHDAILVADQGWKLTWRVSKDYHPKYLAELEKLAARYPGKFNYEVV